MARNRCVVALCACSALGLLIAGIVMSALTSSVGAGTYSAQLSDGVSISRTGQDFSYDFPVVDFNQESSKVPKVTVYPGEAVKRVPNSVTIMVGTNESIASSLTLNEGRITVDVTAADKTDEWSVSFYEQGFLFLPTAQDQHNVICKSYEQNSTTCSLSSKLAYDVPVVLTLSSLSATPISFKVTIDTHEYKFHGEPTFSCDSKASCNAKVAIGTDDLMTVRAPGTLSAETLGTSSIFPFSAETSPTHKYGMFVLFGGALFCTIVLAVYLVLTKET
eukprot:CAMPEP_0170734164 /NCGR_PEP_ID=MMETSP0437-20130122/2451_1 /TAXON_ID=0 /ORGANISM="Sexangularia sp." /LENGTH=275 /DNA_ID=CAMNT_0011072473 /DNA_START=52 /DNA_END=876 /DNA_ORIENTATION=-